MSKDGSSLHCAEERHARTGSECRVSGFNRRTVSRGSLLFLTAAFILVLAATRPYGQQLVPTAFIAFRVDTERVVATVLVPNVPRPTSLRVGRSLEERAEP
jgi:hypothetical protein